VSREDWACVVLIVLGILLFLYGANYYDNFVGWMGVFLAIGGFLALIALYIYNFFTKPKLSGEAQNP
jgi:membrane-bound ClpP family serine protease